MKLEDREKEITKLENKLTKEFLSDQEINETYEKLEKLKLETQESKDNNFKPYVKEPEKKPSKLAKLQKLLGKKEPPKPATWDEINQLKLDYQRARLKKGIAVAEATMPKKQNRFLKMLNTIHEANVAAATRASSKRTKRRKKEDEFRI